MPAQGEIGGKIFGRGPKILIQQSPCPPGGHRACLALDVGAKYLHRREKRGGFDRP